MTFTKLKAFKDVPSCLFFLVNCIKISIDSNSISGAGNWYPPARVLKGFLLMNRYPHYHSQFSLSWRVRAARTGQPGIIIIQPQFVLNTIQTFLLKLPAAVWKLNLFLSFDFSVPPCFSVTDLRRKVKKKII